MNLKGNNILLFLLILIVPVYLFMSNRKTSSNTISGNNGIIDNIKSIFGIKINYPEEKLKKDDINDSAISSVNYKYVGGKPTVNIIRNKGAVTGENTIYYEPQYIPKDNMSANDIESTEYRFAQFNENTPSKAWVDYNISQYPGYYKSDFSSNFFDLKKFFDSENKFRETPKNTAYYDRIRPACPSCYTDVNDTTACNFNGKLERIPVSLYNVGPDGESVLQNIISSEIDEVNNHEYLAYNYANDKPMNGSNFYNDVYGVSSNNNLLGSSYEKDDVIKCL